MCACVVTLTAIGRTAPILSPLAMAVCVCLATSRMPTHVSSPAHRQGLQSIPHHEGSCLCRIAMSLTLSEATLSEAATLLEATLSEATLLVSDVYSWCPKN